MKISYIVTFILSVILIVLAFTLQDKLSQFRSLGLLGIFLINLFGNATIFLPAPAIASVVVGGAIYPPLAVAIVSALGASFGDMTGFLFGFSGKDLFIKKHSASYLLLQQVFAQYGGLVIFFFALIPNPFFDIIGILGGAFSYSPLRFFAVLFIGRLLRDVLLAYAGSAFGIK